MWFVYIMLGNAVWSISDVAVSMIVNKVDRSPLVVGWYIGCIEIFTLVVLALFLPLELVWLGSFFIAGVCIYIGLLLFLVLLSRVDVSVSSAAWVFMSVGIAAGGFIFFDESWSIFQAIGAVISIAGVLLLSFWHKHVAPFRTCGLLALVGLIYVPYFLIQKGALLAGVSLVNVFFWPLLFQKLLAVIFPLLLMKKKIFIGISKELLPWSLGMMILVVAASLLGFLYTTLAYDAGLASLVGIAENGQPFFLMFFAWIAIWLVPKYAPKELVTAQSFGIKIISFCIVFTGLGLLALG